MDSLSFNTAATPTQITLLDQQIKDLPFSVVKGNDCPTPVIAYSTSFEGEGISIVNAEGTGGKLRFNEALLEHMQTYSVSVTASFDSKEFSQTYEIKVIKCGISMVVENAPVVLNASSLEKSRTYSFAEECGSFELTWSSEVVVSDLIERSTTIPTADESIVWMDTADFTLPVTVSYDV